MYIGNSPCDIPTNSFFIECMPLDVWHQTGGCNAPYCHPWIDKKRKKITVSQQIK